MVRVRLKIKVMWLQALPQFLRQSRHQIESADQKIPVRGVGFPLWEGGTGGGGGCIYRIMRLQALPQPLCQARNKVESADQLMTILSGVPSVLHTMALRCVVCEFLVSVVLRSIYSQKKAGGSASP
jgi:hypothetical protein